MHHAIGLDHFLRLSLELKHLGSAAGPHCNMNGIKNEQTIPERRPVFLLKKQGLQTTVKISKTCHLSPNRGKKTCGKVKRSYS